jgi:uncharacterized membrane protein required for colicin V production
VDIVGAIKSTALIDLGLLLGLTAFFFLGVVQGAIRRLLGIASMLVAFIFAANLRNPVGDFLAGNWTQFDLGYNRLLAFGIIFIVGSIVASITIQGFYKRTDLTADHPIADDAAGGLLGLLQGVVVLTMLVIIFNSYTLPPPHSGDVAQVRQAQDLVIHESRIAGSDKDILVPPFVRLLSPLLPNDLTTLFP